MSVVVVVVMQAMVYANHSLQSFFFFQKEFSVN